MQSRPWQTVPCPPPARAPQELSHEKVGDKMAHRLVKYENWHDMTAENVLPVSHDKIN